MPFSRIVVPRTNPSVESVRNPTARLIEIARLRYVESLPQRPRPRPRFGQRNPDYLPSKHTLSPYHNARPRLGDLRKSSNPSPRRRARVGPAKVDESVARPRKARSEILPSWGIPLPCGSVATTQLYPSSRPPLYQAGDARSSQSHLSRIGVSAQSDIHRRTPMRIWTMYPPLSCP